jgi:glycosyltransferase involved in cell wall biosynthesis
VANHPKVSVCIPTYNGADYISEALVSVLSQTFQDFEIVIVDNGSTDQTEAVVAGFTLYSNKIRYFQNENNIGLAGNFNRCMELARGKYIKYLCVDDLLMPDCLERLVTALEGNPEVTLVCGARYSIDEQGQAFALKRYSSKQERLPGHKVVSRCLFGGNYIGEPTAVIFRKADVHSGFRDDLPQLMDMELWFRLLEEGALLSLEAPVCSIRFHEGQMTQENIRSGKLIEDNVCLFREFSGKSYLKVTTYLMIKHKLRMTYRIWISRNNLDYTKRTDMLSQYGLKFVYNFMPIISLAVIIKRIILGLKR